MTRSEGLEARLLEALEGHRWLALEVLEADGTRRTRMLTREKARELALWVQGFAAWRVVDPEAREPPPWITGRPAPEPTPGT